MNRLFLFAAAIVLGAAAFAPAPASAAKSYDNCTGFINALPAIVSASGTWCLSKDLATGIASGTAIAVAVNNVTIDCNDFKISNLAAGDATAAYGIRANNRSNLTVRGCNLRGFAAGIAITGNQALVEDNRLDGTTQQGIAVEGFGYTVRRNQLADLGGSTVSSIVFGILGEGTGDVIDNTINGASYVADEQDYGHIDGIRIADNLGGSIKNNRIRELSSTMFGGAAIGISVGGQSRGVAVDDNVLLGDWSENGYGIITLLNSSAICKDNVVQSFQYNMACTDGGGNFIDPVFDET